MNGSYLRVKNVTLSYNFPKSLVGTYYINEFESVRKL